MDICSLLLITATASLTVRVLWLLHFHPLAKIPGPWILSTSYLPQLYYDGYHSSRMYAKICEWHKAYGPIIRIGPREVHIQDADSYHRVHKSSGRVDKDPHIYLAPTATFSIPEQARHSNRRRALNPFYSPEAARTYEHSIQDTLDILCVRLSEVGHVNLSNAFRAWSFDTMCRIYLGHNPDLLGKADFGRDLHLAYRDFARLYTVFTFIPTTVAMALERMFHWKWLRPGRLAMIFNVVDTIMRPAIEVYESAQTGLEGSRESILYKILTRDLDASLKTPDAMQNEIIGNILAGTEAVANALLTITFHLLQNPGDCRRLKVELQNQPAGGESPFKSAVIKEGLRMQKGAEFREPRICPDRDMYFHGHRIPRGTTISTTPMSLHENARVFEDPFTFRPDRWLAGDTKAMDRHSVPFSVGRRQCLGKNIADTMLRLAVAALFQKLDLNLASKPYDGDALKLFPSRKSQDIMAHASSCSETWYECNALG